MSKKTRIHYERGHRFPGTLLTVLENLHSNSHSMAVVRCQCDCGNVTDVVASVAKRKQIKSCGCLLKERWSQPVKAQNVQKPKNTGHFAPWPGTMRGYGPITRMIDGEENFSDERIQEREKGIVPAKETPIHMDTVAELTGYKKRSPQSSVSGRVETFCPIGETMELNMHRRGRSITAGFSRPG